MPAYCSMTGCSGTNKDLLSICEMNYSEYYCMCVCVLLIKNIVDINFNFK